MNVAGPPIPLRATMAGFRRFTVDEYHKLIEIGVLTEDDDLELLEGYLVNKMSRNPPHDSCLHACLMALLGVIPIQASSGKTQRHRLNRGGDRQGNSALWRIVICRMNSDPRTQAYVERRTKDGLSKPEIIRCLKRYVARELFNALPREALS